MSIDRSRKAERHLAPYAVDERQSRGRLVPEAASPSRTLYARDRDRILHSTAFRRLTHKTQVFIAPGGDHKARGHKAGGHKGGACQDYVD